MYLLICCSLCSTSETTCIYSSWRDVVFVSSNDRLSGVIRPLHIIMTRLFGLSGKSDMHHRPAWGLEVVCGVYVPLQQASQALLGTGVLE